MIFMLSKFVYFFQRSGFLGMTESRDMVELREEGKAEGEVEAEAEAEAEGDMDQEDAVENNNHEQTEKVKYFPVFIHSGSRYNNVCLEKG